MNVITVSSHRKFSDICPTWQELVLGNILCSHVQRVCHADSEEECLRCVEKMRPAGFAIRRPHANESFLDYLKTLSRLN